MVCFGRPGHNGLGLPCLPPCLLPQRRAGIDVAVATLLAYDSLGSAGTLRRPCLCLACFRMALLADRGHISYVVMAFKAEGSGSMAWLLISSCVLRRCWLPRDIFCSLFCAV